MASSIGDESGERAREPETMDRIAARIREQTEIEHRDHISRLLRVIRTKRAALGDVSEVRMRYLVIHSQCKYEQSEDVLCCLDTEAEAEAQRSRLTDDLAVLLRRYGEWFTVNPSPEYPDDWEAPGVSDGYYAALRAWHDSKRVAEREMHLGLALPQVRLRDMKYDDEDELSDSEFCVRAVPLAYAWRGR